MTSQGFRACKQALWSSFQQHARPEETPTMDTFSSPLTVTDPDVVTGCLSLDRDAFRGAIQTFLHTPELETCFPYEDPLVVRAALNRLARCADVQESLWAAMHSHTMAMEGLPARNDGSDAAESAALEDATEIRNSRMTITLPSEMNKDFARRKPGSPVRSDRVWRVNWTCYHGSIFVFLNDELKCHVEPAALRQCRHALTPDGDDALSSASAMPACRPSLGLVPESVPGVKAATGNPGSAPLSPRVYRQASLDKELQCMMDVRSLPRGEPDGRAKKVEETNTSPLRPPPSPHAEASQSLCTCSASTGPRGQTTSNVKRMPVSRESSPPARVAEAAAWAQLRTRLQLSGKNEAATGEAIVVPVLEGSCDVPSPSPIHSHDRHGSVLAHNHVSVSPPTSTVRGRSTIEISVDLNELDDTDDTTDGEPRSASAAVEEPMKSPSPPPPPRQATARAPECADPGVRIVVAGAGGGPEAALHRSSPPRRPGQVQVPSPRANVAPVVGLQTRSASEANQAQQAPLAVVAGEMRLKKKNKTLMPAETHVMQPDTQHDNNNNNNNNVEGTASRPVHQIRTRGTLAAAPVLFKDVHHGTAPIEARGEEDDAVEAGRRTTAMTLEATVVDAEATRHDFDPVEKPQQPESQPEAVAAQVTRNAHVASAPSPSMTPRDHDDDDDDGKHDRPAAERRVVVGTPVSPPAPPPPRQQDRRVKERNAAPAFVTATPQTPPREQRPVVASPAKAAQPQGHGLLRTPRRGQLPEPHRAPQQDVNPRYNGLAPPHLDGNTGGSISSHKTPATPPSSPSPQTTVVVGVPFAIRSAPHTPRPSGTASSTHAKSTTKTTTKTHVDPDESPRAKHRGAGSTTFSSAAGVEHVVPSRAGVDHQPETNTTVTTSPASPPQPQPPARPPSRDRRAGHCSGGASPHSFARGSGSGRGRGRSEDGRSSSGVVLSTAPAVPRSRPSSRCGSGRVSSSSSLNGMGTRPANNNNNNSSTPPPPRTPSRHASPFFRTASQTTPPSPPRHRPQSSDCRPNNTTTTTPTVSERRREPFHESVAPRATAGDAAEEEDVPRRARPQVPKSRGLMY